MAYKKETKHEDELFEEDEITEEKAVEVVEPLEKKKSSKKQGRVVSFNKHSGVLVYEYAGRLFQDNSIKYDGHSEFIDI